MRVIKSTPSENPSTEGENRVEERSTVRKDVLRKRILSGVRTRHGNQKETRIRNLLAMRGRSAAGRPDNTPKSSTRARGRLPRDRGILRKLR